MNNDDSGKNQKPQKSLNQLIQANRKTLSAIGGHAGESPKTASKVPTSESQKISSNKKEAISPAIGKKIVLKVTKCSPFSKKIKEEQPINAQQSNISKDRFQFVKGMSGTGEQYQDHKLSHGFGETDTSSRENDCTAYHDQKLGQGVQKKISHPTDGGGKEFQDHRIGNGIDHEISSSYGEEGKKYQDHKLAHSLEEGLLDISAGQGEKYHDHRLGKGIKPK